MSDDLRFGAIFSPPDFKAGFSQERFLAAPVMPGPAGPDASVIRRKAGGVLAAPRVVKATFNNQVVYPNLAVPGDKDLVLGLTQAPAGIGAALDIRAAGLITNEAWTWELGPVWCGPSGQLIQSPPSDGWTLRVATAISPTALLVSIDREGSAGDPIDPGDIAQYFIAALNS